MFNPEKMSSAEKGDIKDFLNEESPAASIGSFQEIFEKLSDSSDTRERASIAAEIIKDLETLPDDDENKNLLLDRLENTISKEEYLEAIDIKNGKSSDNKEAA